MAANPWMKFYPRDWRGEQCLRAVSMAARGFWIECLCIMHEAKPYGHLTLNGEPIGDAVLARMTGTSVEEVSAWMAELAKAGVLSMTREGVVFSRRMVKDEAASKKGAKAVKKRWGQAVENKEKSNGPNRVPSRVPITQKPEARRQKEEITLQQQPSLVAAPEAAAAKGRRQELDDLTARLTDAAGLDPGCAANPGFAVLAPILGLIDAGYSLDEDILPVLRAKRHHATKARGWAFYVDAIREARERRLNIAATPAPKGRDLSNPFAKMLSNGWQQTPEHYDRLCKSWFTGKRWPDPDVPVPGKEGSFVPLDHAERWLRANRKLIAEAA